jgi:NitT/TauT family transport system ATP-binding protein
MATIELRGLSKVFKAGFRGERDVHALSSVSFTVRHGELTCLVGPSGCGKTTILRIIAGLEQPTSGVVLLDGKSIIAPSRDCGMVFQEFALLPWRTVLENIELGPEIQRVARETRRKVADHYLQLVGLRGFENKYPRELSGGMKQRVAIARSLANDPKVLLMDEPFGSLDAQTRNIMQEELLDIWSKTGKTIVFVTHSVDEAVYLADRVVLLTARPASVREIFEVRLPRPRDRLHYEFMNMRAEILTALREEVKQEKQVEPESSRRRGCSTEDRS